MRRSAIALLLLAGCGSQTKSDKVVEVPEPSGPPVAQQVDDTAQPLPKRSVPGWESAASGEGLALRLVEPDGKLVLSIACLGRPPRLVASVPSFTAIASEDRFSLGLGNDPVTLVADPTRQKPPGITGEGAVTEEFDRLFDGADQISAVYGRQQVGPHPAPQAALKEQFAKACQGGNTE
jgi:hypothetical protein